MARTLGVASCFLVAILATTIQALSIDDVILASESLAPECRPADQQYYASTQARALYKMGDDPKWFGGRIPEEKRYQSFECGPYKGTIYYYEFDSSIDMDYLLERYQLFVWGKRRASWHHPEMIKRLENLIVVVSSRDRKYFKQLVKRNAPLSRVFGAKK